MLFSFNWRGVGWSLLQLNIQGSWIGFAFVLPGPLFGRVDFCRVCFQLSDFLGALSLAGFVYSFHATIAEQPS